MDCVERISTFSIINLSDEVLLEICQHLTSEDILSLSQSCTKFNVLLCDRKLIRKVDFRAMYSLSLEYLKCFLQPQLRCKNIDTISLSSCYWLTSSDITWAVQRLVNLKSLHVDDTQLSIKHLTRIFSSVKMIQSLSWTFHMTSKVNVKDIKALSKQLQSIKILNLWIKNFGVPFLPILLQFCSSVEDLRLTSLVYRDTPLRQTVFVENVNFQLPRLKSLVLNLPEGSIRGWIVFLHSLLAACQKVETWHTLWLDVSADVWHYCSQTPAYRDVCCTVSESLFALSRPLSKTEVLQVLELKNLKYLVCSKSSLSEVTLILGHSKLSHLLWNCETLPESFPENLEHLCILCNGTGLLSLHEAPFQCNQLVHLSRLTAPFCMFLAPISSGVKNTTIDQSVFRSNAKRKSHLKEQIPSNCLLDKFFTLAPNVQHLELKCASACKGYKPTSSDLTTLVSIGHWTQLQSLFLENICLIDFSMLVEIASKCCKLQRLGLKHVGFLGSFPRTRELTQAITCLEFLEDFRFEHPVVERLGDILDELTKRKNLRRVVIICKRTNVNLNISAFINIVKECPQLVFLYACISSITVVKSKEFQKTLKSMNINRPLWARVEGIMEDSIWETCPTVHCNEMLLNPSCLNIVPPFCI